MNSQALDYVLERIERAGITEVEVTKENFDVIISIYEDCYGQKNRFNRPLMGDVLSIDQLAMWVELASHCPPKRCECKVLRPKF